MDTATRKVLHFDGFSIDVMRCAIFRGREELPLRPKAFDVLRHLAEHAGRLVSKDELIQAIWPGVFVTDDSLVQCVKEIREALGDDAHHIIKTVPRRGYLFAPAVSVPTASGPATIDAGRAWRPTRNIPAWQSGFALAAVILLLVAAGAGSSLLWSGMGPPTASAPSRQDAGNARTKPSTRSIAVLPFTHLGNDSSQDYLADALVEDITTELSRSSRMAVIAYRSALTYRNRTIDAETVGRELAVRYLVLGSMLREGDALRLNVRLVEAASGRQLWAARFDYRTSGRLEAQNRIVAEVGRTLGVELVIAESRRTPANPDATDLALRARALMFRKRTPSANQQALELFERALALDSDSIDALIGVAETNLHAVLNLWAPESERTDRRARAETALARAIELDPSNASARLQRGVLLRARGDAEQAVAAFEHAIQLNPNLAGAHASLGRAKMDIGLAADTVHHIEEAISLSPRDPALFSWCFWAGQAAVYVGEEALAAKWLRRAIEANPEFPHPLGWLAVSYALLGREDEGRKLMAEFLSRKPGETISGWDSAYHRGHPGVSAQRERIFATLRRLGVPE